MDGERGYIYVIIDAGDAQIHGICFFAGGCGMCGGEGGKRDGIRCVILWTMALALRCLLRISQCLLRSVRF